MKTSKYKKITQLIKPNNRIASATLFLVLLSSAFSSQAVSLTSYRLYLDDNNRTESFIVFAKGNYPENCSLKLKHFNFDNEGKMTLHKGDEEPDNSASPWIRFSPKQFIVKPKSPQTIRFTMRRKPNTEAKEYRSYLSVSCQDIVEETAKEVVQGRPTVSVKPNLVQNVPIVVRTGALKATAQFDDIVINDNSLSANLKRQGDRSIYGRVSLVNKKTNEELRYYSTIALYPETTTYHFDFSLKGDNIPATEDMILRFVEDENYGGSLSFEQSLK